MGLRDRGIEGSQGRPRGAMLVLTALLLVWDPLTLALAWSGSVSGVVARGAGAVVLLFAKVTVAGLGVAAGMALWNGRPHGVMLARATLLLSAVTGAVTMLTPLLPHRPPARMRGPMAALLIGYSAAWLAYLGRIEGSRD